MAVGITILSGARKGEELGLDQREFRAGDDSKRELFFDPLEEPDARGCRALFQLGTDGWYMKNVGERPLLVNGVSADGRVRLRSNDVIRLSASGPEFSFKLLANLPCSVQRPAAPVTQALPSANASNDDIGQARRGWAMAASAVAGTIIGLIILYALLRQPAGSNDVKLVSGIQPAAQSGEKPETETATAGREVAPTTDGVAQPRDERNASETVIDDETSQSDPAAPSPTVAKTQDAPDDAVLLVLVEEPKTAAAWPFGTAAAIADHALLTSATVATGLAEFQDKGWKLWVTSQRQGLKLAVSELRVHAGFVGAQGSPEKQVYADLGLLGVAESLPERISLATADELADLDRGLPVTFCGYLYDNEPIDRFQTFVPEPHPGKIFVVTSLPPSPGGPRLMHIRAELSGKMYGAPVLNSAGHVLGVFAETALPEPGAADLHLHYAPVADRAQIDRWIKDRDDDWWVAPVVMEVPK